MSDLEREAKCIKMQQKQAKNMLAGKSVANLHWGVRLSAGHPPALLLLWQADIHGSLGVDRNGATPPHRHSKSLVE